MQKKLKSLPYIVVILGQTATGKSDFAIKLACKIDGEVVSADSRQVYKGLNIGSGKITKKEMRDVPHHLLDVVNPRRRFTVAEYKLLSDKKIQEIFSRGKTPIICGGTGFYIDAVVNGTVFPDVPPNTKLRKKLDKRTSSELLRMLKKLDPRRARKIDPKNKVRIIRAIEIAKSLGRVPPISRTKPKFEFIKVGLWLPPEKIKKKIKKRLLARLKIGMVDEVKKLHASGLSWRRLEEFGLEYRYVALYLQKKISKSKMIEELENEIYHYAKRQITWFKRDKEILWVEANKVKNIFL